MEGPQNHRALQWTFPYYLTRERVAECTKEGHLLSLQLEALRLLTMRLTETGRLPTPSRGQRVDGGPRA